jgi:pyruvyl transferase EpsO
MSGQPEIATRLDEMRERVHRMLEPLIDRSLPVALIDFPRYANVGDSAIWAGQTRFLASLGIRPTYTCDLKTYDRRTLARRIRSGTILLTGGGNFVDLYPRHQELREEIISAFPDNPIIQLPQSIRIESPERLDRARRFYDRHEHLTLLLRDRRSLETVQSEFQTRSELCPDMAFCLPPLSWTPKPSSSVVWLMRDDDEAIPSSAEEVPASDKIDWRYEPRTLAFRWYVWCSGAVLRSVTASYALQRSVQAIQNRVAMGRVARGCAMLGRGRAVVTDRLHGHILCVLLGIPHVLLDNSYGKNRSFYETWTAEWSIVRWADSASDASALVKSLAQPSGGAYAEAEHQWLISGG